MIVFIEKLLILNDDELEDDYPHNTKIFRKYYKNIPLNYVKIAKKCKLLIISLKCCSNLAMFARNITNIIF